MTEKNSSRYTNSLSSLSGTRFCHLQRARRQTDGPFKCYFCQTPKWHKRLQTDARSLTRIIQLSLRLFFKTSKHTRAADRPDDVVTSFVKLALRLQAPLLSRVCVRACIYMQGMECLCRKNLSLIVPRKCANAIGRRAICLPTLASRLFVMWCVSYASLHVDFATCFFLSETLGKTKSIQPSFNMHRE